MLATCEGVPLPAPPVLSPLAGRPSLTAGADGRWWAAWSEQANGAPDLALIAWAPDATAKPVSVRLPTATIRPAPG